MKSGMSDALESRILRALRSGPLYRPMLEFVVGASESQVRPVLTALVAAGKVELARWPQSSTAGEVSADEPALPHRHERRR